jgi:carbamoyltransferase
MKRNKKTTKIVGFQSGHDVSYCILEHGIPVIHEEMERITRIKMEYGNGLKFFFERQKKYGDIKYFTFANVVGGARKRYHEVCHQQKYIDKMNAILAKNKGEYYEFGHHLAHGANAFYTSDFDRALIVSIDGFGNEEGRVPTTFTIDEGVGNKIKRIQIFNPNQVPIGAIWNRSTKWIFGLSVGPPIGSQEGSVMAMAALGKPIYTNLFSDFDKNRPELIRIAKISDAEKYNVAASLQEYSENIFFAHLKNFVNGLGHENLCISGGVSLNCVMVGKIKERIPRVKKIFCDPVPYDAGLSLGSARYLWHHVLGNKRVSNYSVSMSPYLGLKYKKNNILKALSKYKDKVSIKHATDNEILVKINDQKIIGVFGGGSESGRRALGNRSILADPRSFGMKDLINQKVKHRAWYRPLAPSILEEEVADWFENPLASPYMSFALKVKDNKKQLIPAVIHFDGTARLQTVNKKLNPWFYKFISRWKKMTQIPILVNTSFNDSEPIVETPMDAIMCFLKTEIDYLYFFEYGILVEKVKMQNAKVNNTG